jgi:hypothetical protein
MTQVTLPNAAAQALLAACRDADIRTPDTVLLTSDPRQSIITWASPDLSAADIATLQTIQSLVLGSSLLTVVERQNLQADIDGLVTYQGLASPTLAQTVLAVKAQSRILRALLRN